MQATFIRDLLVSRTTGKHAVSMLSVWVSKRKARADSSQVSGSVPSGRTIAVLYKANLCGEGLVLIPEYPSVTRGRTSFLLVETTTGNLRHGKWGRPLLTSCRTRTNAFASAERSLRVLLDVEGYTYQYLYIYSCVYCRCFPQPIRRPWWSNSAWMLHNRTKFTN